jgi:predicted nucleic acid-binding protein
MVLVDVDVLVYAHQEDSPGHAVFRRWLVLLMGSEHAHAVAELATTDRGFSRFPGLKWRHPLE